MERSTRVSSKAMNLSEIKLQLMKRFITTSCIRVVSQPLFKEAPSTLIVWPHKIQIYQSQSLRGNTNASSISLATTNSSTITRRSKEVLSNIEAKQLLFRPRVPSPPFVETLLNSMLTTLVRSVTMLQYLSLRSETLIKATTHGRR